MKDFSKEFPKFTSTEQERLYQRLFRFILFSPFNCHINSSLLHAIRIPGISSELLFVQAFNQWRYGSYSGHYHLAWEYRGATLSNNAAKMIALCSSVVPLSSSKHFSINPFITALHLLYQFCARDFGFLNFCVLQVGTAFDTVGQLVEEQCLDHFFSDKWVSIWFLTLSECWVLN
ncbi:hypothetical protein Gotri_013079 [Gossypium trilobum]|uniref:Uncharacterized protein n=1 Tax=Gossypium trilobum TaxID=34281 RepID=A0A7J9DSB9_9ROSI|nr:hypothetical protein [Gossypium trilobum]